MNVYDAIMQRRTIRKFTQEKIDKEQLKKHESLDLITKTNKGFKFTQKGREISNNIFLDYID